MSEKKKSTNRPKGWPTWIIVSGMSGERFLCEWSNEQFAYAITAIIDADPLDKDQAFILVPVRERYILAALNKVEV